MSGKLVEHLRGEMDNSTKTENSMPAYKTTYNACLDLFFLGAAYRERSDADVIKLFSLAFRENMDVALRILAYFRDVRDGAGERRFFRLCLKYLAENGISFNVSYIPVIGRWDDMLSLIDTNYHSIVLQLITDELVKDKPDGLCAKWMPRKGRIARLLREEMGIYPKDYRQLLVKNTKVVETKMCEKQWSDINYSHVPSVANTKYNNAFLRHDEDRRRAFLGEAAKGNVSIKSSVAFPHTIVGMMLTRGTGSIKEGESLQSVVKRDDTAIAMWKQLPNVIGKGDKRILFCSDTSGSMGKPHSKTDDPIKISLAMGIYCSERLEGPFKNAFITFSQKPELQFTEGNLYERLCQVKAVHPRNTDLYKVFKLVLDTAQRHRLDSNSMPTDIVICSDMEFDKATGNPRDDAFTMIRKMYADSGYDMPNIIFWNVNAKSSHFPIQRDSRGVALLSGASQNAIMAVMNGVATPVDTMLSTVMQDRYGMFLEEGRK